MTRLKINSDLCIGCGLCVKDCVGFNLKLENNKVKDLETSCIACGHCEAICPKNAIVLEDYEDEIFEYDEPTRLDPQTYLKAIQTRRTIRSFTDEAIDEETVHLILEAGRLAPTGGNGQKTSYVILDEKKAECEAAAVKMFRTGVNLGSKLIAFLSSMTIDDQFFFKGAPLVILICGGDTVSASLAAQNMATMAEACGLGVLFSGFFTTAANHLPKIKKIIDLDSKQKVITTLVIGHPAVKYKRSVHRNNVVVKKL